jgi:hypothetical protein
MGDNALGISSYARRELQLVFESPPGARACPIAPPAINHHHEAG